MARTNTIQILNSVNAVAPETMSGSTYNLSAGELAWIDNSTNAGGANGKLFIGDAKTGAQKHIGGAGTGAVAGDAGNLTGNTLAAGVVTSSLTTVGALAAGSLASGFGSISIGSSTITNTGACDLGATTVDSLDVSNAAITNVGDIDADSISIADAAVGLNIDFSGANTGLSALTIANNVAEALVIQEGSNDYMQIVTTTGSDAVKIGHGVSGTAITLGHSTSETTVADNLTVSGNITVTGDMTINGSTTTLESDSVAVKDLELYLAVPGGLETAQAWTRSTTTASVALTDHGFTNSQYVLITSSSDESAITNGLKTVTRVDDDNFTFTCLNAGDASGTLAHALHDSTEATADEAGIYIPGTSMHSVSYEATGSGWQMTDDLAVAGAVTGSNLSGTNTGDEALASSTVSGTVELEDDTVQIVAAATVSATAARSYGLQVNSAGQGIINVPWTDTNTNTVDMGDGFIVVGDSNSNATTIIEGETLTIAGGTGITTDTSADGTLTITSSVTDTNTVDMGDGFIVVGDSNSNATTIIEGETLTIAGGTGISTDTSADGTLTITGHAAITNHVTNDAADIMAVSDFGAVAALKIDADQPATTAAEDSVGLWIDYDRIVAGSGTANHNDTGIDLDVDGATLGTGTVRGIDIDVNGASSGTSTAIGLDITTSGADTNTDIRLNHDATNYATIAVGANGTLDFNAVDASSGTASTITFTTLGDFVVASSGIDIAAGVITNATLAGGTF